MQPSSLTLIDISYLQVRLLLNAVSATRLYNSELSKVRHISIDGKVVFRIYVTNL